MRPQAAVPEVGGGVFIGDEEEGYAIGSRGGEDGVRAAGVVFLCVDGEGLGESGHQLGAGGGGGVVLDVGCFLPGLSASSFVLFSAWGCLRRTCVV